MSALLWVEDFEGIEGGRYRLLAYELFGRALNLQASHFPSEEYELREFLRSHQIVLTTTFAEAARFIASRLAEIDGVVLDIDLELVGEETNEDLPYVEPLLEKWYEYYPKSVDAEASYRAARDKMKRVAGYHLFVDLVFNRGFPRKRILFCSNHGDQLTAISDSFGDAKIEAPAIYTKGDERIALLIEAQLNDRYLKLRRWVILACRKLSERVEADRAGLPIELPDEHTARLRQVSREILLETLPKLLPAHEIPDGERSLTFRLFVRTLTQDWDPKNSVNFAAEGRVGRGFAEVLRKARNWTSHDAKALSRLEDSELTFLLLVALRACFDLSDETEDFEKALLPLVGEMGAISEPTSPKAEVERSYAEVKERYVRLNAAPPVDYFWNMVNKLQECRKLSVDEQTKCLMQILWHYLSDNHAHKKGPAPRPQNFRVTPFVAELMPRIYHQSFGTKA